MSNDQRPERIRLSGIDCPEKRQAYGKQAKQAASGLVYGKKVTLQTHGLDKYGRTIGDVLLPDGTNVNHTLVKEGWCWWYRKYAPGDMVLEGLEKASTRGADKLVGRSAAGAAVGSGGRGSRRLSALVSASPPSSITPLSRLDRPQRTA